MHDASSYSWASWLNGRRFRLVFWSSPYEFRPISRLYLTTSSRIIIFSFHCSLLFHSPLYSTLPRDSEWATNETNERMIEQTNKETNNPRNKKRAIQECVQYTAGSHKKWHHISYSPLCLSVLSHFSLRAFLRHFLLSVWTKFVFYLSFTQFGKNITAVTEISHKPSY